MTGTLERLSRGHFGRALAAWSGAITIVLLVDLGASPEERLGDAALGGVLSESAEMPDAIRLAAITFIVLLPPGLACEAIARRRSRRHGSP